jgi:hypothetical protein
MEARTRAFDSDFWPQLQKAYTKLRAYQYGREEGDRMIIDNEEEENRCIQLQNKVREEILGETENIIRTLQSTVSEETFNQMNRPVHTMRTMNSFAKSPNTFEQRDAVKSRLNFASEALSSQTTKKMPLLFGSTLRNEENKSFVSATPGRQSFQPDDFRFNKSQAMIRGAKEN